MPRTVAAESMVFRWSPARMLSGGRRFGRAKLVGLLFPSFARGCSGIYMQLASVLISIRRLCDGDSFVSDCVAASSHGDS